jgi:hypothetical protein
MNPGINNIVFFNHFHNGDLHVSRGFLRLISEKILEHNPNIKIFYAHKNNPELLSDIKNIQHSNNYWNILADENKKSFINADTLFLSTWYAAGHMQYLHKYGITFDCLYELFDDHCRAWLGFSLSEISQSPSDFFPTIDYSNFCISEIDKHIANLGICILVCNGLAMSGQATNFNLSGIAANLARQHTNMNFILTNVEGTRVSGISNLVYSSDIIKKTGSDLNENSYLSTFCPIIVGRSSGAFSYALTKNNMFNSNKTFISFSNSGLGYQIGITPTYYISTKFYESIKYSASILSYDVRIPSAAEAIINAAIARLK